MTTLKREDIVHADLLLAGMICVFWRFFSLYVDAKVAVVLNQGPLDNHRAFPEVLHQDTVVHVLLDQAV